MTSALRAVRGWGYRRVHQLLLDEGWELNGCASPSRSWPCHILAVRLFGLSQPDGVRGARPIPPKRIRRLRFASLQRRCSSSVLGCSRGTGTGDPTSSSANHRQICRQRMPHGTAEDVLGLKPSRPTSIEVRQAAINRCAQREDAIDPHTVTEPHSVHSGCDYRTLRMAHCRDHCDVIAELHDPATVNVAGRVSHGARPSDR